MTGRVPLLAVSVAAIALVLSGCDDMTGTGDVPAELPHHGTWYFDDPVPGDGVRVLPDARLVLTATKFTLAMGDDSDTPFTLFMTPGITKFEVTGTYMIGADGSASFALLDPPTSAVTVEPDSAQRAIADAVVAAAAALQADSTAMLMVDPANLDRVTISGSFLPGLLNLPDVTEVTACKGAPCASS